MSTSPHNSHLPLPAVDEPEGKAIAPSLLPVVDAHVHLFPSELFKAIWQWFDRYGWPIRYRLHSQQIIDFLVERGVMYLIGLHYAHKPGIAQELNRYMARLCRRNTQLKGMATVFPGEPNATDIVREAFDEGLSGVKLHSHVQYFDMNSAAMHTIYETCTLHNKPLVMHVGRAPKNSAFPYKHDPYELCQAEKLERVLKTYPDLRVCVPHLGADEFLEYQDLCSRYDTLWLDTAMAIATYLPVESPPPLHEYRIDRTMYGSDFPNIPYAWDRELNILAAAELSPPQRSSILAKNALSFFNISMDTKGEAQ